MKKILLFVKSFNDFDQALPFIDYVVSNTDDKILVWSFDKDLSGCREHKRYLKNNLNVSLEYLDEKNTSLVKKLLLRYLLISAYVAKKSKKNKYFIPLTIVMSHMWPILMIMINKVIARVLSKIDIDIILMDTGSETTINGRAVVNYANLNNIPVVCYSHGYSPYINIDHNAKDRNEYTLFQKIILKFAKPKRKRIYADRYITSPNQKKYFFSMPTTSGGFEVTELDRVVEVGIPRFTYEWVKKYKKTIKLNSKFEYGDSSKLNVVMFMTPPKYNVSSVELYKLFEFLDSLGHINFVFKPHTRYVLDSINKDNLTGMDASDINSVLLSEWADVALFFGSSVSYQLILDKVPLIYPKYVTSNDIFLEDMDVCIPVHNQEDIDKILSLDKARVLKLLNSEKRDTFIRDILYGGVDNHLFMKKYYNSILGI